MILFFALYQLIQILLFPFLSIFILFRKIKGKPVFGSFKERFGFIPKSLKNKNVFWIHAASVGEVLSIQNTITKIKKNITNSFCYLTVGTLSGKKIAQQKKIADIVSFIPYDFLFSMLIAFKRIKPKNIIIVEAETWPNFVMLAKLKGIQHYIINARINEKSKHKYQKFKFIYKMLYNTCTQIYTQSKKDTLEFINLGINKNKLITLGNIKIPNVLDKQKIVVLPKNIKFDFTTLLVGSIHPGELDIYINLFNQLKAKFNNLKLILAPRHFNWKKELLEKLNASNISYIALEDSSENIKIVEKLNNHDALVVLKLGELFNLYQFCNIFFLGGTFVPVGGHNLLEPAVWAKPSIIGPYYSNCKVDADNLEKAGGLIKVQDEKKLLMIVEDLLKNKQYKQMGQNACNWLLNESESINKKLNKIKEKRKYEGIFLFSFDY